MLVFLGVFPLESDFKIECFACLKQLFKVVSNMHRVFFLSFVQLFLFRCFTCGTLNMT